MSFVSFKFIPHKRVIIVDSEFGEIKVDGLNSRSLIKAYSERNLSVGKNLALAIIWYSKQYGIGIDNSIREWNRDLYYDRIDIPNYEQHIIERDRELEKLLPLL